MCEKHGAISRTVEGYSDTEWLFHKVGGATAPANAQLNGDLTKKPVHNDTPEPAHTGYSQIPQELQNPDRSHHSAVPREPFECVLDHAEDAGKPITALPGSADIDCVLASEGETDYTYGQACMIEAWDGEKGSAAVLPTMDLPHRIQDALLVE